MIIQKINALKLVNALLDLHREDPEKPRMSLIDMQILLLVNEHKNIGKNEMLELINGSKTSKSFLDKPVNRLLKYNLITKIHNENAVTKDGQPRATYSLSKNRRALSIPVARF